MFSRFGGVRYLIDKRGEFPTGLWPRVKTYLESKQIAFTVIDERQIPNAALQVNFEATLRVKPYPEQIEAARAAVKAHRGIITACTGFGKSLVIALIVNFLKFKTLIVVPNLELKRQLRESLTKIFGKIHVGGIGKAIAVENISGLKPNEKIKQYQCVILDEYHHAASKSYLSLNKKAWDHIYFRLGLTATPYRSQNAENILLESILSSKIYEIPYSKAVKAGYVVPVEAYYYEIPTKPTKGNNWHSVYKDLVVQNYTRNELIATIINILNKKASTLCLVKEIAHGEILSQLTGVPFANGKDGESKDLISEFNSVPNNSLIGTSGVIGEGVDTKPAEYIIIAGLGKSKNAFMQQVGRGMRRYGSKTSCKVIIFKDLSHKWSLNHFREQVKILREEYNVEPVKLEVDV